MKTYRTIPSGVPQGSNLAPFLFGVNVNNIRHNDDSTNFTLYTDDMFVSGGKPREIVFSVKAGQVLAKLENGQNLMG